MTGRRPEKALTTRARNDGAGVKKGRNHQPPLSPFASLSASSPQDSLSYLAPAHVRMVTTSASAGGGGGGIISPSALEYVSSVALVFPTLVSMVDDEDRSRVLSGLAILSKLSQVWLPVLYHRDT